MAKLSQENFHDRLNFLAGVKKANINESNKFSTSTLIDFQKANDGTVYGIVKENHHYYIKKSTNQKPTVADFVYMGGLENIKEYQYSSLAEADKQRNMYIKVLNETLSADYFKKNTKKSKSTKTLNEAVVSEDETTDNLDKASKALDDLDVKVDSEEPVGEMPPEEPVSDELPADELPADEPPADDMPPADAGDELPAEDPLGGGDEKPAGDDEELPDLGGDELPTDDEKPAGEEPEGGVEGNEDLVVKELEKLVGKFGEKASETELSPVKAKALVKQFLGSIKDSIAQLDVEERKDIADEYFMEVVPDEEIKGLETSVGDEPELEEAACSECGTFENYAKNMGYESLDECPQEEMAGLIGGYATAHADGQNDGDFENVAVFVTPEIADQLSNDYGHVDYVEKMQPYLQNVGGEGQEMPMGGFEAKPELESEPNALGEDEDDEIEAGEEVVAEPEVEKPEVGFAPDAQVMGAGVAGGTKSLDINLKDGTVNMTMSESDLKLRKYIRNRLDEKLNGKKSVINESKKSPLIKKLDEMIDKQISSHKSIEKKSVNEIFGFTVKEKFSKLNPDDQAAVDKLLYDAFSTVFTNDTKGMLIKDAATKTPVDVKYDILRQFVQNDSKGTLVTTPDGNMIEFKALGGPQSGFGQGRSRLGS